MFRVVASGAGCIPVLEVMVKEGARGQLRGWQVYQEDEESELQRQFVANDMTHRGARWPVRGAPEVDRETYRRERDAFEKQLAKHSDYASEY